MAAEILNDQGDRNFPAFESYRNDIAVQTENWRQAS
jgi:hypothetical protein